MGFEGVPLGPRVFTALQGASLHPASRLCPSKGVPACAGMTPPLVFALTVRSQGT